MRQQQEVAASGCANQVVGKEVPCQSYIMPTCGTRCAHAHNAICYFTCVNRILINTLQHNLHSSVLPSTRDAWLATFDLTNGHGGNSVLCLPPACRAGHTACLPHGTHHAMHASAGSPLV